METVPKPQRAMLWGDCFIGRGGLKGIIDLLACFGWASSGSFQAALCAQRLCTAAFSCGINLFFAQRQILAFKECVSTPREDKNLFSLEQREQKVQISLAEH